jgi:F-type H+-transporting ATPase subunit b
MPRQPILAFGLVALALALGPGLPPRAPAAEPQHKEAESTLKGAERTAESAAGQAAHEVEAAHAPEGEPNILEPQPSLAIWTVVVFLGLLFVLGRFAWKPLLNALHQREEHLEHVLLETERARNESEQLLAEHRRRLAAAEEQVRALVEEARRNAQTVYDDMLKKAQAEAEASKQRAEHDIRNARDQALSEIWSKTADLAVSVAGKVLGRSLTEDDHKRLIDSAIGELNATSNGHGGARS